MLYLFYYTEYPEFHHRETLSCDIQNCHPANWPIRLLEINMRYKKRLSHILELYDIFQFAREFLLIHKYDLVCKSLTKYEERDLWTISKVTFILRIWRQCLEMTFTTLKYNFVISYTKLSGNCCPVPLKIVWFFMFSQVHIITCDFCTTIVLSDTKYAYFAS